jgi:N-acetylmuramoyl-L-alanine amidase
MHAEVLTHPTRAQGLARHVAVAVAGASLATVLALGVAPAAAHAEEDNQEGAAAQVAAVPSAVTAESLSQRAAATTSRNPSQAAASASAGQATATSTTSASTGDQAAASDGGATADASTADGGAGASSGAQAGAQKDSAASASKSAVTETTSDNTSADATVPGEDTLPEGTYTIVSGNGTHKALDVSGASTSNGANVQIYEQNGTDAQHWRLTYNRDRTSRYYGMARLVNVSSGKALDVYGALARSGANVQQYAVNGSSAQWWQLVQDAGTTGRSGYLLRSALQGYFALDVSGGSLANGTNVQIWASNGTAAQRFTFVALADEKSDPWLASGVAKLAREHASDLADGTYVISASGNVRSVLDVYAGSRQNGGNVQVWASNNTGVQRWVVSTYVASDGTPWRTVRNANSGKVLDVAGARATAGTNVQQYASNNSDAQRWAIVSNGDGTLSLRSALGRNLVLDLWCGSTSNGTNADVYTANGTAAQRFVFTTTSPIALASEGQIVRDGLYVIKASDGKAIDVPGASTANGQQLQTYVANGTQAQAFAINYDKSTGYYHVSNVNSAAALDLDSGDVLPGGKVQQWTYGSGNWNQLWILRAGANGTYSILSPYANLALAVSGGKLTTVSLANAALWTLVQYELPAGMYQIANRGNGLVIDVPAASWATGTKIQTYASNGTIAQKWYLRTVGTSGSGAYTIQSVGSGKYLAPSGSTVAQVEYPQAAKWNMGFRPGVGLVLTEASSGSLLYANPMLALGTGSDLANLGWRLASTVLDFSGEYELAPASNMSTRLDVAGASASDGANVDVYVSNGTKAQRWALSSDGDGWFAILSRNSGKALDIDGASTLDGANVWQYSGNNTNAQRWLFKIGDYGIVIKSALGTVLGVPAGTASGSNVFAQDESSLASQCWLLKSFPVASYLIAIDPGHGGNDPGASGNGLQESTLTWKIASALRERLVANGVGVYFTKTQNESVSSIKERVLRAISSGAKALVSVHINSAGESAQGAYVLTPNNSSYNNYLHVQGRKLGSYILQNIAKLGIKNDGYLERNYPQDGSAQARYADGSVADYYGIVRYSRQRGMLGVIVEHGFITNVHDAALFASDSFLRKLGQADADGIIQMYGTSGGNASSGSTDLSGDAQDEGVNTTIMGATRTSAAQIARYFKSKGATYPSSVYSSKGAATIEDFAKIVVEEATAEGVRAEVVFSQAMHETGWLKFGGLVTAEKCNFAGLGATGNSSDGAATDYGRGYTYKDVRTGIRAQVQHLMAYASTEPLVNACVDQRFKYVTRGCAPTVGSLSGKWAVPGNGYGESIAKTMSELLKA